MTAVDAHSNHMRHLSELVARAWLCKLNSAVHTSGNCPQVFSHTLCDSQVFVLLKKPLNELFWSPQRVLRVLQEDAHIDPADINFVIESTVPVGTMRGNTQGFLSEFRLRG